MGVRGIWLEYVHAGETDPHSLIRIMPTKISFLNPYPTVEGERKEQVLPTRENAIRMVEFYNSIGPYKARIEE